jgi:hypothetical protein
LAYHIALIKGTDVDQPRNLAKSVTGGIVFKLKDVLVDRSQRFLRDAGEPETQVTDCINVNECR